MPAVSRLAYLGFEAKDLDGWERFAIDVLGLGLADRKPDGTLAFRMDDRAQRILVHPGGSEDLAYAGFETAGEQELLALVESLRGEGIAVAEAAAEIDAARAVLRQVWEPMLELADSGQPIPLELRIRARRGSAEIVTRGIRAVDVLFEASGGRGIFLDNPMQRYFRDVHAMRAHAMNNADKANSLFGRAELRPGEPPRDLFL